MSGASWPAKKADESGRARFIQFLGNAFSALPCPRFAPRRAIPRRTVGHRRACVPAWDAGGAGVREARDRADYRAFASACVSPPTVAMGRCDAPFRCAAPARCGAFVDARRVVASDGGGPTKADAKRSSRSLGQCGSADCHKRGTRPSNLAWVLVYCCWVREAGARTDKILPNPTGAALS
jgi:hypothetical protein